MINFQLETITPETAKRLLDEHDEAVLSGLIVNRHRKASAVRRIAADILADQWFPDTGETIKFEANGDGLKGLHLVDGQTRLAAVDQAKRTIKVWVAKGVEREAFVYIDSGDKRTLKNVLQISGEPEASILAPALNWLSRWDFAADTFGSTNMSVSHAHARKLLEADPAIRKSAQKVHAINLLGLIGKGLATFLHRIFAKKDQGLADRFLEAVATGEQLSSTDPFYVLRERLIANKAARLKMGQIELSVICIKAWNAVREGRTIKKLSVNIEREGKPVLL